MSTHNVGGVEATFKADMGPLLASLGQAAARFERMDASMANLKQNVQGLTAQTRGLASSLNASSAAARKEAAAKDKASKEARELAASQAAAATATARLNKHLMRSIPSFVTVRRLFYDTARAARAFRNTMMMVVAATALVSGIALKEFAQFEESMVRVKAVSGATEEEFAALSAQARSLAKSTIFSAKEIADGMQFMAMAGLEVGEVYEGIEHVLRLSTAAMMDIADAADIVTNIMVGFGKQAHELEQVTDVLVETFTSTNTNVRQLGDAFKYAGPIARGAGQTFEMTAASIGILSNAGWQGEMAGTALRGIIMRLQSPTAATARRLEELGIEARDATGQMKPLNEIVGEFQQVGEKFGQARLSDEIGKIFAQRAGPGFTLLMNEGPERMQEFADQLRNAEGAARSLEANVMETLSAKFMVFQAQLKEVAILMGEGMAPAFTELLGYFSELSEEIDQNKAQFKEFSTLVVADVVGGVRSVIEAIVRFLSYAMLVTEAMSAISGVAKSMSAVLLQTAKVAFYQSTQQFDKAQEALAGMASPMRDVVEEAHRLDRVMNGQHEGAELMVAGWGRVDTALGILEDGLRSSSTEFGRTADQIDTLNYEIQDVTEKIEYLESMRASARMLGDIQGYRHLTQEIANANKWLEERRKLLDELNQGGEGPRQDMVDRQALAAAERARAEAERQEEQERRASERAAEAARQQSITNELLYRQLEISNTVEGLERMRLERARDIYEIRQKTKDAMEAELKITARDLEYRRAVSEYHADAFHSTLDRVEAEHEALRAVREDIALLETQDEQARKLLEHQQNMARIVRETSEGRLRELMLMRAELEYQESIADAAEKTKQAYSGPGLAQASAQGAASGFRGIASDRAGEQDQSEKITQLQEQARLSADIEQRIAAQNELYDLQRQIAVDSADAQIEAFRGVANELAGVAEAIAKVGDENLNSEQKAQAMANAQVAAMQGIVSGASTLIDAFEDNSQRALQIQAVVNAVMAAAAMGFFLSTGSPSHLAAAGSFAASSAAMGISSAKAGSVPGARRVPFSASNPSNDGVKKDIIDALTQLGLTGQDIGDRTQNYYLYDPVASDRRDVQSKRLKERAGRARLLSTEED